MFFLTFETESSQGDLRNQITGGRWEVGEGGGEGGTVDPILITFSKNTVTSS